MVSRGNVATPAVAVEVAHPVERAKDAAGAPTAGQPAVLDRLRTLLDVRSRSLADINARLIDYDGHVTPSFRELFGLTDAEVKTLQEAATQAHEQLARYRRENTTVKVGPEAIELSTVPFAGGADLYDQMLDQFSTTLGPERYQAFMQLQAQNLQWVFGQFGAQSESVTVTRTAVNDGSTILTTKTRTKGMTTSTNGSGAFRTVDELVLQYPALKGYAEQLARLPVAARPPKR